MSASQLVSLDSTAISRCTVRPPGHHATVDIHFGDGNDALFRSDERVLICNTFEAENYGAWWAVASSARRINVPFSGVATGQDLRDAFKEHIVPAVQHFDPQLVMFSAGFDGHRYGEISRACFLAEDYFDVTDQIVAGLKGRSAKFVSTLEGGYAVPALGLSVVAHVNALRGAEYAEVSTP